VHETSQTPGAAAEAAAERKTNKYTSLAQSYLFQLFVPVAAETMGAAMNKDGMDFLGDLRRRITQSTVTTARARLPLPATLDVNSTLQCGRCLGYLHPHNPRARNEAVPALF